jgi:hypothetical protein
MKNIGKIFICIIGLSTIFSFNQKQDLKLDNESFLLGTLSDYMGRIVMTNEKDKIDNYGYSEKSLVTKINSLLIEKYDDLSIRNIETGTPGYVGTKLYSKKLAEKINSNYTFEKFNLSQNNDTIFYEKLKTNIFETELQKISFIIGAYSRFGEQKNGKYCIRLFNSTSKFNECEKILRDLNCENIETEFIKNIPLNQLVYFKPSKKLKKYFDNYIYLRNQIKIDQDKMFKELSEKHTK